MSEDKKPFRQRLKEGATKAVNIIRGLVQFDALANYRAGEIDVALPIDFEGDTLWATQAQMATLFGTTKQNISSHLKNLFDDNELDREAVVKESLTTASDGKAYRTTYHNLDAILAVGFKVNSRQASAFRQWAFKVLKGYIQDGYALNGERLQSDPAALLRLAQDVRAIRTSEKNLYTQVREAFAQCAIDYDKDDPVARTFFFESQDIFHYAASGKTAVQIVLTRADASKPNMGLTALGNRMPTMADVTTAKNFCTEAELRKMQIIGEAWLLYAEGMAMQGKQVSMTRLLEKLRALVKMHEFPVFEGYGPHLPRRDTANAHAKRQLEMFKQSNRLPPAA